MEWMRRWKQAMADRLRRRRQRQAERLDLKTILARRNDHLLEDIGLTRQEAERLLRLQEPSASRRR